MTTTINAKQFLQKAYDYIADGWIQGYMYTDASHDTFEDETENDALRPANRPQVTHVCSVGAMRVAFADLVGVPIHVTDYGDEVVDAEALVRHPFYAEGMKILGRAFRDVGAWAERLSGLDYDKLLDGEAGRPYTDRDVEHAVIQANDADATVQAEIEAAFLRAIELAPEDLTTEPLPAPVGLARSRWGARRTRAARPLTERSNPLPVIETPAPATHDEPPVPTFEEARTEEEKSVDALVKKRVQRGIALLEKKHGPNWVDRVDLETLELMNCENCVLGQLYGRYSAGTSALHITFEAPDYGFTIRDDDGWGRLQAAWMDALTPRVEART